MYRNPGASASPVIDCVHPSSYASQARWQMCYHSYHHQSRHTTLQLQLSFKTRRRTDRNDRDQTLLFSPGLTISTNPGSFQRRSERVCSKSQFLSVPICQYALMVMFHLICRFAVQNLLKKLDPRLPHSFTSKGELLRYMVIQQESFRATMAFGLATTRPGGRLPRV